jgi:preprotein translocase subunit YajC
MKTRRTVYLFIGIVLIFLNILAYVARPDKVFKHAPENLANSIPYYIGAFFVAIIGFIFLFASLRLQRKIKRKNSEAMDSTIKELGEQ